MLKKGPHIIMVMLKHPPNKRSATIDIDGGSSPQEASTFEDSKKNCEFLRLLQEPPRRNNVHHEPLVDYS